MTGIGSVIGPRLARGLGSKVRTIATTQLASLVFLLLAGFTPLAWLSSARLLARYVDEHGRPALHRLRHGAGHRRRTGGVNRALSLFWQLGFAVGPFISGIVQEQYGFSPLFIATAVVYCCAASLTWIFFQHSEKVHTAKEQLAKAL